MASIGSRFEASRYNLELRLMGGWRDRHWLVAFNPVFGWALSRSQENPRPRSPQLEQSWKVARTVADGVAIGFEYYNDLGPIARFDPASQQGKTLFAAVDVSRGALPFNFGIGRGLNGATDRWTIKAIFEIPFGS